MERIEQTPRIPEHNLVRRIGRGASGEVWLAQDALGNWRAVKLVFPHPEQGDSAVRRELAGLRRYEPVSRSHRSLLDILFAGTDTSNGVLYYVMELADDAGGIRSPGALQSGETNPVAAPPPIDPETYVPDTLSRRLRLASENPDETLRRLPSEVVVSIAEELASGLEHLHAAGLVHRDLKPGNVVFVQGRACLADCGLVSRPSVARSFVGTEGFVPPEGPGSHSADLYSLGKIIYEAAFGLDRNDWPEVPRWLGKAPDLPRLQGLLDVIHRACARQPEQRYSTAAALLNDLRRLEAGHPIGPNWAQRRRLLLRTGAAVGIGLLAALALRPRLPTSSIPTPAPLATEARFRVETLPLRPDDYAGLLPILTGDSQASLHFFAARQQDFLLLGRGAEQLGRFTLGEPAATGLQLWQVADVNGDGSEDALFGWREGTRIHLSAVSQYPREFRRFTVANRRDTAAQPPADLTHFRPITVVPARDGQPGQLLALSVDEPNRHDPTFVPHRAVLSFATDDGHLLWKTPITGGHSTDLALVPGSPGGIAFLFGGYGPANGVRVIQTVHPVGKTSGPVELDDEHAYLHALDHQGRLVWVRELADFYVNCRPFVVAGPTVTNLYARVWANDDARSQYGKGEVGRVHRFDATGNALGSYDRGCGVFDHFATDLDNDGQPELLLTDSEGRITILSPELQVLREIPLVPRQFKRVELRCLGHADLDGDGSKELVFSSVQVQPEKLENFGRTEGGGKFWRFHQAKLLILDRSLRILDRHPIAETAERNPCETLHFSDLNPERRWEVIRQGQQVEVIRWLRR